MGKRLVVVGLAAIALAGCGYDGHYRYPCQNPDNWPLEICQPPTCETSSSCPRHLVPESILNG